MKYTHQTIKVDEPAAGHFVITGHNPMSARTPEGSKFVPLEVCHIGPQIPTDLLEAIISERKGGADTEKAEPSAGTSTDASHEESGGKRTRAGRKAGDKGGNE